jgi:hypothetical protein
MSSNKSFLPESEDEEEVAGTGAPFDSFSQSFAEGVFVKEGSIDFCTGCSPVVAETFAGSQLSQRGKCCQICLFEGKGVRIHKVVTCQAHQVRVCADVSHEESDLVKYMTKYHGQDTVYWCCPDLDLTCWEKLHQFYIPSGLFPSLAQLQERRPNSFCNCFKTHDFYMQRNNCAMQYFEETGKKVDGANMTASALGKFSNAAGRQRKESVIAQKSMKKFNASSQGIFFCFCTD